MPTLLPVRTGLAGLRAVLRKVDAYTLWAFNPQPPLGR